MRGRAVGTARPGEFLQYGVAVLRLFRHEAFLRGSRETDSCAEEQEAGDDFFHFDGFGFGGCLAEADSRFVRCVSLRLASGMDCRFIVLASWVCFGWLCSSRTVRGSARFGTHELAKIQKRQDLADMKRKMANFIRLLRLACGPMRLFYLCSGGNYPSCEVDTETGLALCGRGGFR